MRLDDDLRLKLKEDLNKLVAAEQWGMIRTWFSVWGSEEEMTHKCHLWGYMFMSEYFRSKGCDAQLVLIKENLSNDNEYTAFPRGFAKTTINQLTIGFECANGTQKFVPVIEKTHDEAANVLEGVHGVFSSAIVKQVYGNLIGKEKSGLTAERASDAKGDIFINGVRLRAVGFEKTIRGLKTGAWRPTKIYVDDVEKDDHIGNPEQRLKYLSNYTKGIIPAVDVEGSIKVRGTILHYDSLLMNLIEQHDGLIFKAYDRYDPINTLLWPAYWTLDRLDAKKNEMMSQGLRANAFYQEFLNEPISEDDRDFKWDEITQTYTPDDVKFREVNRYAAIDMADTVDGVSDYTGVAVEDIDKDGNWFNVLTKQYKLDILGVIDLVFDLWQMPNMRKIGIEKKSFEDQIKPLIERESSKRGIYPIVVELKHRGKHKVDRIKGALQPRYVLGQIFNKEGAEDDTKLLWDQLYSVGNGRISSKNDDLMDAKAYISDLAEEPMSAEYKSRWQKSKRIRREDPLKKIRNSR